MHKTSGVKIFPQFSRNGQGRILANGNEGVALSLDWSPKSYDDNYSSKDDRF